MRVLVTGGAGYIGSHATRWLQEQGHQVWVYDNLSTGHRAAVGFGQLVVGDLTNGQLLERTLARNRIEAVVHFAGVALVGESVRAPGHYYRNNVVGSLSLMEAMRRQGVDRIVFSSTCATYGVPRRVPIKEEEPQRPINPYGQSKLAVEQALSDYASAYGWGVAILRYFNAAGAHPDGSLGEDHDPETHLIPRAIRAALGKDDRLEIFGTDYLTPDGTCVRDYVHVNDLAEGHALALQRLEPGRPLICNLGNAKGHSVREVVRAVEEVTGRRIAVRKAGRRPGDPPVLVASSVRAREVLGWVPRYRQIRDLVETAWNWHRRHPQGYATAVESCQRPEGEQLLKHGS